MPPLSLKMQDPFKLKCSVKEVFERAAESFGRPDQISPGSYGWRFYSDSSEITLVITCIESCKIEWSENAFDRDQTMFGRYEPEGVWKEKLSGFIRAVRKPWEDWTEDEFLSDPMWIFLLKKSQGRVPEVLHNAMVIFSYENPENKYIRKYFQ